MHTYRTYKLLYIAAIAPQAKIAVSMLQHAINHTLFNYENVIFCFQETQSKVEYLQLLQRF